MDIVKRYTYLDFNSSECILVEKNKYRTMSRNWVQRFALVTSNTCVYCASHHGHILSVDDPDIIWPPVHERCRCLILPVRAFPAGTATEDGLNGVDFYLFVYHCLPDNYMTKKEAELRGWVRLKRNLWDVLPGTIIGAIDILILMAACRIDLGAYGMRQILIIAAVSAIISVFFFRMMDLCL